MAIPSVPPYVAEENYLDVDGLRTHYLELGSGPTIVLLHGGEFGASGILSWEYNLAELAKHFHVVVPDWLGYGESAKVHDFENLYLRMVRHMGRLLETLGIRDAQFVGNSMGAAFLLRDSSSSASYLHARSVLAISGGGAVVESNRRALIDYDGTRESMVTLVGALFHAREWPADSEYVDRRHRSSLIPGAWECAAAARFRSPVRATGQHAEADYSGIAVPTMLIAGQLDKLKPLGYAREIHGQIDGSELHEIPEAGHCAQIERPAAFHELAIPFLLENS